MSIHCANSRRLLLASTSALSFLIAAPVFAQATAAPSSNDVQEVVVSGFRASLQNALDAKRDNDLPIESIAPEDIGKMPDQNVAEALQRLPGLQIDRSSSGQGSSVLIDGLRQNLTTLDGSVFLTGKEYYAIGEASHGGNTNQLYGSLEGVPSEEIGGIDVYKNPKASLTEGGLGGTIDLKTRDPLAGPDGWSLGGNFRESMSEYQKDWTPNGTLVGSYKFSDRFAVDASFSYDWEHTLTHEFEDYNRGDFIVTNAAAAVPASGPLTALGALPNGQSWIAQGFSYFGNIDDERKTIGSSVGMSWKVTDSISTRLSWFYSHEDETNIAYYNKADFNFAQVTGSPATPGAGDSGIDPTKPYSIGANGVLQSATLTATGAESSTVYQNDVSNANNLHWVTQYNGNGPFRAKLEIGYAYATNVMGADDQDVEHGIYNNGTSVENPAAPGCNNGAPTCTTGNPPYQFTYNNGGTSGNPKITYPAGLLSNPAYATYKSAFAWGEHTAQQNDQIKMDFEYDPAFIHGVDSMLSAGFRIAGRDLSNNFGLYLMDGTGFIAPASPHQGDEIFYQDAGVAVGVPFSTPLSLPSVGKTVNIYQSGPTLVKDPVAGGMTNPATFLNTLWNQAGVKNNSEAYFSDNVNSFSVNERTNAGYLMADLGGPSNGFHANFGVRIVQTNLDIHNGQPDEAGDTNGFGGTWDGVYTNVQAVETHRSYTDVLPSLNFTLDLDDTQKVRFGAARVESPQDLYALAQGNNYNYTRCALVNGVCPSNGKTPNPGTQGFFFSGGTAGNTQLNPYEATQGLLSYENYFNKNGLIQVSGFWKQIDNFILQETIPTVVNDDFGGTSNQVSKFVNAGSGRIYGIELGGQYAFGSNIAPWLEGFGVAGNYTLSSSTSYVPDATSNDGGLIKATIPGVSKNSLTLTGYYERAGFSARASWSWRDTAINDGIGGSTATVKDALGNLHQYNVYSAPYGELDAQIGYDVNEHFGLTFSIQNLTDEAQHTYLGWPDLPWTYDDAGRRFFLGGKFKL